MSTHTTRSPEETEALGARVAVELAPGALVLISGDLGAGKTTFVRGACRALGIEEPVTSPTFTIGERYRGEGVSVSHLDLYRLADMEAEDPALLDDYLDAETIAFVEWPDAAAERLGSAALVVTMRHAGEDRRDIELDSETHGG